MKAKKTDIFSENALVVLVSVVTLLLQLISFATTWSGSRIYLEGVFPCASLLFAVAIQATAYFFSNSLRNKVSALKIIAMLTAICCSTYYSYIGIYNSVNSPARFLQEKYVQLAEELTGIYDTVLEKNVGDAREAVNDAVSKITASFSELSKERENIEACRAALSEEGESYAAGMRAPKPSEYEEYEDYVTAYNAYVAGISNGSNTEKDAARSGRLAAYGFASMEALTEAEAENTAAISALAAALGLAENGEDTAVLQTASDICVRLYAAMDGAMQGETFESAENTACNRLFQAAKLCGYERISASEVITIVKLAAEVTREPLLRDYTELVASLEEERVTPANIMELKNTMDSELLGAMLKLNAMLPAEEQISYSDVHYAITDLYLIPVQALMDSATRMTAFFCLGIAALIDMLSVLFAISLRKRKPLWKRRTLMLSSQEEYTPQIYASLPGPDTPTQALTEFLGHFAPSPETEADGYMMQAEADALAGYQALVALLCQINMAKLVPAGLLENEKELLLLKARFVFWANAMIYEENSGEREVSA